MQGVARVHFAVVAFGAFSPMMLFSHDPEYQAGPPPRPEAQPPGVILSPDTLRPQRIPPGQSRTRKWPVLDAFGPPAIDPARWRLQVFGLVDRPRTMTLEEFAALPRVRVFADFHCVTRWSRLGNLWEGVATRTLLEPAGVRPEARYVVLHAYDQGWTTNLPLADFLAEDALLADRHDGRPLSREHGGPVRVVVPRLYAWKSAKWVCGIELVAEDQPGYWEQAGYHLRGDPWTEQRFRDDV
jgi:DMSO/TMAO reductase YedYZ molybdopterin-dependent catalytic subunit